MNLYIIILLLLCLPFLVLAEALNIRVAVLILVKSKASGAPGAQSVADALDGYGIPFNIIEIPHTGYNDSLGLEIDSNTGNYSAIVFADGDLQYYNETTGTYPSALTPDQYSEIENYESKYKVRRVMMDVYPNHERFGTTFKTDCCGMNIEEEFFFNQTTLPKTYSQFNPNARLSSKGLFHYNTVISDSSLAIPLLMTDAGVVGVITKRSNGREEIIYHSAFGNFGITSIMMHHVWISWAMKGVFPGFRNVLLSTQIDDVFLPNALWDNSLKKPNAENSYKMTVDDLNVHAEWMKNLNRGLPKGSNFKIELAFNGNGLLLNSHLDPVYLSNPPTPEPVPGFIKPLGTGNTRWPLNYSRIPDWPLSVLKNDTMFSYFTTSTTQSNFYWLSHTFTHEALNNVTYDDVHREIYYNQLMSNLGMPASFEIYFSRDAIVTPEISGLQNGDALRAMYDLGIRSVIGDNSRPIYRHPSKTHWMITTNLDTHGFNGMYIIPRHATEVYFHASTGEENLNAYNHYYGNGSVNNITELMEKEAERVVRYMLLLRKDPHMFHQSNLRVLTEGMTNETLPNGTTGKFSLLMRWVEHVTSKYTNLVQWPIFTLKQSDLYQAFLQREERDRCGYDLFLTIQNNIISQTRLKTKSACRVPIMTRAPFAINSLPIEAEPRRVSMEEPYTYWVKANGVDDIVIKYDSNGVLPW